MTIIIAASVNDKAAMNIADKLIEHYAFSKTEETFDGRPIYRRGDAMLVFISADSVLAPDLGERLKASEVILASRHESATKKPTLCVHVPGNLTDETAHGGRPREVAWANPLRVKALLQSLYEERKKVPSYSISLEVTHHGPTEINVPVTFIEIGSSYEQWTDDEAGSIVAKAILNAVTNPLKGLPAVGFGGTHYAPAFTELSLKSSIAIGHIIPKYVLERMETEILKEVIRKNVEPCRHAVLDWKGMRSDVRKWLLKFLEKENLEVVRI